MPYVIYREAVDELTSALYKAGLVVPLDRPDWQGLGRPGAMVSRVICQLRTPCGSSPQPCGPTASWTEPSA